MQFELNDDQRAIQAAATRFSRERIAPGYQSREADGVVDRELMREMGGLGLIAPELPERFGGMAVDGMTNGVVIEAVAYGDFNMCSVQLLNSLVGDVISTYASADICDEWLTRVTAGEALLALGLTEPRGGSDAANLALKARRVGNGYMLDGEKTSISFADQADAMVVLARTGAPEDKARGISAFFVDLSDKGIRRCASPDLGERIVGRGSVFFDRVQLPADALLGEEGEGFVQVMRGFDYSRALIGLQCIAPAQASLDETWPYIAEREAFGAPLAQYQGVSFPLAEGETLIKAARLLCYNTLWLRDNDRPHTSEAAMCKWWAPKVAYDVIHQCLLSHGHTGYGMDLPFQQRLRDVLGLQIGDGTAQIMKLVIAREKVGRVAVQYA